MIDSMIQMILPEMELETVCKNALWPRNNTWTIFGLACKYCWLFSFIFRLMTKLVIKLHTNRYILPQQPRDLVCGTVIFHGDLSYWPFSFFSDYEDSYVSRSRVILLSSIIIIMIIIIISITKCSIVIGFRRAYLIRNWTVITWVSNYSCPIWTFCNWIAG